jgi:hypothetical protein
MAEEFDVDVSASDLIALIRADQARRSPTLWVSASRTIERTDVNLEAAGVAPDDEVAEETTRGTLEVRPRRGRAGWVLRMSLADTAGEHIAGEEDTEEAAEELTLDAFEEEFLRPEGRLADISVTADDGQAKARFGRWLRTVLSRSRSRLRKAGTHGSARAA